MSANKKSPNKTPEEYFLENPGILQKQDGKKVYCLVCKSSFKARNGSYIASHLDGPVHLKKVNELISAPPQSRYNLKPYGDVYHHLDDGKIQCTICRTPLSQNTDPRKHSTTQHHLKALRNKTVCDALLKMDREQLHNFFAKNIFTFGMSVGEYSRMKELFEIILGVTLPCADTMRKKHLWSLANEFRDSMIQYLRDKKIFVSIDETTDKNHRSVAVIVIGTLEPDGIGKTFLFDLVEMSNGTSADEIKKIFENAIKEIWPEGDHNDSVLYFTTDGAANMKLAAKKLSKTYLKMVHVTCVAHALSLVAKVVVAKYPKAKAFIQAMKKFLSHSSKRVGLFSTLNDEEGKKCKKPPRPIEIRWGSYLAAAQYYVDYYEQVKRFIDELKSSPGSSSNADAANELVELFESPETMAEIREITQNYGFMVDVIKQLQKRDLSVKDVLDMAADVTDQLTSLTMNENDENDEVEEGDENSASTIAQQVLDKWTQVIDKNKGLEIIQQINSGTYSANTLQSNDENGTEEEELNNNLQLTEEDFPYYNFASLVTVEAERIFSRFTHILSPLRRNALTSSIRNQLTLQYNSRVFTGQTDLESFIEETLSSALERANVVENEPEELNEESTNVFDWEEPNSQERPNKQIAKRVENSAVDGPSWIDARQNEADERDKRNKQRESQDKEREYYNSRNNQRENDSNLANLLYSQPSTSSNYRSSNTSSPWDDDVRSPEKKKSRDFVYNYNRR